MSEWEILDVMNNHMGMALLSFSAYLTIVFGFLVASYLVAHRLNKVEILTVSGLFVFGAGVQTYSTLAHLVRQYLFAELAKQRLPELFWFNSKIMLVVTGVLMISGIVASLYFMYDRASRVSNREFEY